MNEWMWMKEQMDLSKLEHPFIAYSMQHGTATNGLQKMNNT